MTSLPPATGVRIDAALNPEGTEAFRVARRNPAQEELRNVPVQNRVSDLAKWLGLQSRGDKSRGEAMDTLAQALLSHIQGPCPPQNRQLEAKASELPEMLVLLLRLSRSCPFQDIRERCAQMLQAAEDRGIKIPRQLGRGPSSFIPVEEILQEGAENPRRRLFIEAFVATGRVDNITMVMGLHPEYLTSFWKTQCLLLRLDGPLPYHKRHYVAIMAAARHQCSYLVGFHMGEFLQMGGDPQWLRGLQYAPQKLRNLNEINKILAHRPWLITKEHMEELLKTGENSWSVAELIQALVLLTHYHSLASFVFGCGVNLEIDQEGGHAFRPPSPRSCDSSPASEDGMNASSGTNAMEEVEVLMERMKLLQELEEEEVSQEEMETCFEMEKTESLLVSPSVDIGEHSLPPNVLCFVEDPEFGYKDFTRRGEQTPPTFRAQDYTWEDHGFSLINRLYPDVGQQLDEKFQVVYNLTYNTIAMHSGVDTSMLRRAIWNYVHCVFGIRYDDYDYREVNQLLERSLKVYIKTVACYPEKTTKRMYTHFWRHFKHSEKVHVNLLLLEARMQAALLYALRAITRYMT